MRVDTHLFDGYAVPPYYDSLLAKIIVWDGARAETLGKLIEMLVSTHWMARQTGSWKSLENHGTAAPLVLHHIAGTTTCPNVWQSAVSD